MMDATAAEPSLRNHEAAAARAKQMILWYAHIVIAQIGMTRPLAHAMWHVSDHLDAWSVCGNDEGRKAIVWWSFRIGDHHGDKKAGQMRMARKPFFAIDDPFVAIENSVCREDFRVRTTLRLSHREARNDFVVEQGLKIFLLLIISTVFGEDFGVAGIRGLTAKHDGPVRRPAENFVHQRKFKLTITLSAQFGLQMAGPKFLLPHLLLQWFHQRIALCIGDVIRMAIKRVIERLDFFCDEL